MTPHEFYSHTLVTKYGFASSPYISTNNNFTFFIIIIRDALNFFNCLSAVKSSKCSSTSIASGFWLKPWIYFCFIMFLVYFVSFVISFLKFQSIKRYESFKQVFLKVLNKHVPLKKMFFRSNHVPYMTKLLRKGIMMRFELESKYLKKWPLKIKLKIRNKIVFVLKFIKRSGKKSTQT